MLKYLRVLFFRLFPNYKKVREIYYDDVLYVVKYLQALQVGEQIEFEHFLNNVCKVTAIGKEENFHYYKIAVYSIWDLRREFLPTDLAWISVDGDNYLNVISFDRELFYNIIRSRYTHALLNNICLTKRELDNAKEKE